MTSSEAEAEQLVEDLGLTLPIIPEEVCAHISEDELLVEYREEKFQSLDICGLSVGQGNKVIVIVNSDITNNGRRNFTGAHEVGHVVLHIQTSIKSEFNCSDKDLYGKNDANSVYEKEANEFASSLLMPKSLIGKRITSTDLSWDLIHKLSLDCATSLEATARRVVTLSREQCALVIHKKGQMWTPIRSTSFNGYVGITPFPDYLEESLDETNATYPSELEECDASDWFTNPKGIPDLIQYQSIYNKKYDRRMTLLVIPEVDIDDNDEWESPCFR
ncbi:MAG: ImmA/IrrE family metallo-endopeptidase [Cycloclasticus sp.]